MTDEKDPTEAETPDRSVTVDASATAPQWAIDLKRTIEELPGKLNVTLSDQDTSTLAEKVHGLFERSGAFQQEEPRKEEEKEEKVTSDEPPAKKSGLRGFASSFEEGL